MNDPDGTRNESSMGPTSGRGGGVAVDLRRTSTEAPVGNVRQFGIALPSFALSPEERSAILRQCRRRWFERGDYIFHEGEAGDSIYLIERGRVLVSSGGRNGELTALNILGRRQWFGELALVGDPHRTATVQALERTETLMLRRAEFVDLRRQFPALTEMLISMLAEKVRLASQQIVEMAEIPATKRVLRRIVMTAEMFESNVDGGIVPLTQEQIAALAGAGIRITNKSLREARLGGLISTGKGRIEILDWDRLVSEAGV